ncbi:hypothetical protein [Hugenholtzia roseola]|uniref:hypothetical protein n=1 Tax=Hugenholtzia roseola TaxID=1002 RepID=UPI0004297512|nr:hypothetical protein [Hugenholtzia roseola]
MKPSTQNRPFLFSLALFALIAFVLMAFDNVPALKKVSIKGGKISLDIPKNFYEMGNDEIVAKYYTQKRPTAVFTDPAKKVDIGVNISETPWGEEDVELLKDIFKNSVVKSYDYVKFLREDITIINGRKGVVLEFLGQINQDPNAIVKRGAKSRYHCIFYTVSDYRIISYNFNCVGTDYKMWQETAQACMQTLKVSGKIRDEVIEEDPTKDNTLQTGGGSR